VPRGRCRRVGTVLTEWHRPRPVLDDRQRLSGDRRATSLSFYGPSALFLLIGVGHRVDRRVCAAPVGPGRAAGRGRERRECGDRSVPPYWHAAAIPSASLWPRLTPPPPGQYVTVRLPAPSRRGPGLAAGWHRPCTDSSHQHRAGPQGSARRGRRRHCQRRCPHAGLAVLVAVATGFLHARSGPSCSPCSCSPLLPRRMMNFSGSRSTRYEGDTSEINL